MRSESTANVHLQQLISHCYFLSDVSMQRSSYNCHKPNWCPSVTARHSSSGRQPNFAAWYKEWNYGTFTYRAIYMAGRPSRWPSAHISSLYQFCTISQWMFLGKVSQRKMRR